MKAALDHIEKVAELLKLAQENPFKVRAFEKALGVLQALPEGKLEELAKIRKLENLSGIGKGISEVFYQFMETGDSTMRAELEKSLPKGLVELTQVSGLGPKKAMVLITDLGITSLGELEYACRENRLAGIKGFGQKTQDKILEQVIFLQRASSKLRLVDALELALQISAFAKKSLGVELAFTGELARKLDTLSLLEFEVGKDSEKIEKKIQAYSTGDLGCKLPVRVFDAKDKEKTKRESSPEFYEAARKLNFDIQEVSPECREFTDGPQVLKKIGKDLLNEGDVQGVFHFHTTASDGTASLSQMCQKAIELGFKYVGVTDHSQSAFYAQGLKADALKLQRKEVERVRELFPSLSVFWGIESDILADGGLDYDAKTLSHFDFVIASIHSRFQMDKDQMTQRLLAALDHPSTTMLGHMTGRILLGRKGYDFDVEKVFERAKKRGVIIELNSNPHRLDVDWRHGPLLREIGVNVSINPDAHSPEGFSDVKFGEWMARKALLPRSLIFNVKPAKEVDSWLQAKRSKC